MSAVSASGTPRGAIAMSPARLALLGTGTVGTAVLQRLGQCLRNARGAGLVLVHAANSRRAVTCASGIAPDDVANLLARGRQTSIMDAVTASLLGDGMRIDTRRGDGACIVIDATASEAVADRHAGWLAQGIHVVTACKLGQGASLARWHAIRAACVQGGTRYGDSATVGAGLPLLRSIRDLQAGGDRIHAIAGVLSGSLAWLCHHYDGQRPFSECVRDARAGGYTEPDPREDLSGEDVRRKLLILARAAGVALDAADVDVGSLLPPALAALASDDVDAALSMLDLPLGERYAQACSNGEKLRFIARFEADPGGHVRARVGLESLPPHDPLAGGTGTDNRVAIWSDRYREQPLVIQGPGAGAQVTAAALLDDVLAIAAQASGGLPTAAHLSGPCAATACADYRLVEAGAIAAA